MFGFMKTNTVDITVDGKTYNSLRDFGLAIGNNNCIGAPEPEENMVTIPGRDGPLDMTDAVFGEQHYKSRSISIEFGGINDPDIWDMRMADIRNKFDGKNIKLEFLTTPGWYFAGRCQIKDFNRKRALGTLKLEIPYADPYMYQDNEIVLSVDTTGTDVVIPVTRKTVVPEVIESTGSYPIQLVKDGTSYTYDAGQTINANVRLFQGENAIKVKAVSGTRTVTIKYRNGSL